MNLSMKTTNITSLHTKNVLNTSDICTSIIRGNSTAYNMTAFNAYFCPNLSTSEASKTFSDTNFTMVDKFGDGKGRLIFGTMSLNSKQTPWPLVCERTIPTERQPLVDEI
jgi:hypothetical protein